MVSLQLLGATRTLQTGTPVGNCMPLQQLVTRSGANHALLHMHSTVHRALSPGMRPRARLLPCCWRAQCPPPWPPAAGTRGRSPCMRPSRGASCRRVDSKPWITRGLPWLQEDNKRPLFKLSPHHCPRFPEVPCFPHTPPHVLRKGMARVIVAFARRSNGDWGGKVTGQVPQDDI